VLPSDSSLPFVVPGDLPHHVTLNFDPWTTSFRTMARCWLHAKEKNTAGVIVNTFAELEDGYSEYFQKLTGVKVWHVGELSLMLDYYHRRGSSSQKNHVSDKVSRLSLYTCLEKMDEHPIFTWRKGGLFTILL